MATDRILEDMRGLAESSLSSPKNEPILMQDNVTRGEDISSRNFTQDAMFGSVRGASGLLDALVAYKNESSVEKQTQLGNSTARSYAETDPNAYERRRYEQDRIAEEQSAKRNEKKESRESNKEEAEEDKEEKQQNSKEQNSREHNTQQLITAIQSAQEKSREANVRTTQESSKQIISATDVAREKDSNKIKEFTEEAQHKSTDKIIGAAEDRENKSTDKINTSASKNSERVIKSNEDTASSVVSSVDSMGQSIDAGFNDQQSSAKEMTDLLSSLDRTMGSMYALSLREANKITPKTQRSAWSQTPEGGQGSANSKDTKLENGTFFSDIGALLGGGALAGGAAAYAKKKFGKKGEPMDGSSAKTDGRAKPTAPDNKSKGVRLRGTKGKIIGSILGVLGMGYMLSGAESPGDAYSKEYLSEEDEEEQDNQTPKLQPASSLATPLAGLLGGGLLYNEVRKASTERSTVEGGETFLSKGQSTREKVSASKVAKDPSYKPKASSIREPLSKIATKASAITSSVIENVTQTATKVAEATKSKVDEVIQSSTKMASAADNAIQRTGNTVLSQVSDATNKAYKTVTPVLQTTSKGLQKAIPFVGPALAAADTISIITDDKLSTEAKSLEVAKLAGGTAGAIGGMSAGAVTGAALGSVVPILGTAVGGVVGGLIGAAGGYFGGDALTDMVYDSLSSTVAEYDLGDTIGRAVAVPMSLFSSDARDAITNDFNENVLPSLTEFKDGVLDFFGFAKDVKPPEKIEADAEVSETTVEKSGPYKVTTYPDGTQEILAKPKSDLVDSLYPDKSLPKSIKDKVGIRESADFEMSNDYSVMKPDDISLETVIPIQTKTDISKSVLETEIKKSEQDAKIQRVEQQFIAAAANDNTPLERKIKTKEELEKSIEQREIKRHVELIEKGQATLESVPRNLLGGVLKEINRPTKKMIKGETTAVGEVRSSISLGDSPSILTEPFIPSISKNNKASYSAANDVSSVSPSSTEQRSKAVLPSMQPKLDKVVRSQYEDVKKVMMIEPAKQTSANTDTKKPATNASNIGAGGVLRTQPNKPLLEDVPAVVSEFGLMMINTGFI